jgi:hypothetical protein
MKKFCLFLTASLLLAGCMTTEEAKPVSWREQSAYMARVRDPRMFGFGIYKTAGGVEYRGGARLHPRQVEALPMEAKKPYRPVVSTRGNFGLAWPVLLDITSGTSWCDFHVAQKLGAQPVGENKAALVKTPGEETSSCPSVIGSLRFGQLYIESALVYVRMASGPFGTLARGVDKPEIKAVLGWDILEKFEQIRFDYVAGQVLLASTLEYEANPELLVAQVPLVKRAGVCAVRATVDGDTRMVLIDPVGDYEVATDGAEPVLDLVLGDGLSIQMPAVSESPGGIRIGARFLENYGLVLCPQKGFLYLEQQSADGEE